MAVVRHADGLAEMLGEPYGTLILTLSVAAIEIMTLGIVMTTGDPNPALARDTMFSVVMLVLNGLIGVSLILGALRYKEQDYNLRGANAYLSVIVSLAVFGLVVPELHVHDARTDVLRRPGRIPDRHVRGPLCRVPGDPDHAPSLLLRRRHGRVDGRRRRRRRIPVAHKPSALPRHVVFLVAYLGLVIYLVEKLAVLLDHGLDELGAPPAFGALVVAALVLAPEGLGGIQAALANKMQRAVNILLGSALATLALTIPAVVIIGLAHTRMSCWGSTRSNRRCCCSPCS